MKITNYNQFIKKYLPQLYNYTQEEKIKLNSFEYGKYLASILIDSLK